MVLVNNKFSINVYKWDTPLSLSLKIALEMKSLPRYLYIDNENKNIKELFKTNTDITVKNLLKDILSMNIVAFTCFLLSFNKTREKNYNFIDAIPLNIVKAIIEPYIALSPTITRLTPQARDAILLLLQNTIIKNIRVPINFSVYDIWQNRRKIQTNLDRERIENNKNSQEIIKFSSIISLPYTPFITEGRSVKIYFENKDFSILDLFNEIVLTPKIPFATINNIYKILRDLTPTEDEYWGSNDEFIYLKVRDEYSSKFTDLAFGILSEANQDYAVLTIGMSKNIPKLVKNFKLILPKVDLVEEKHEILKEKGVFFYKLKKEPIDMYVFGDLVMNNSLFSKYLTIDEKEAASKGKRVNPGLKKFFSSVYINFSTPDEINNVKANLTIYRVRRRDKVKKKYKYKIGQFYLQVRVTSIEGENALNIFRDTLGRLLNLYYEPKFAPKVIKYYQKFLGKKNFPAAYVPRAALSKGRKSRIALSDIAPEVFVSGYPVICSSIRQPRIISSEEAQDVQEAGKSVMKFPKTPDEGFPQRWYICDSDKEYPYIGLTKKNSLSNKDLVPFLPCCFKLQQDWPKGEPGKGAKTYDQYFYDRIPEKIVGNQKLVTRDIFVDQYTPGILPNKFERILNLLSQKENKGLYIRTGVSNTKSSLLECVLEALSQTNMRPDIEKLLLYRLSSTIETEKAYKKAVQNKNKKKINTTLLKFRAAKDNERSILLTSLRKLLSEEKFAVSCKQEMYEYTIEEIMNQIANSEIYLEPKYFSNLLSKYFKCNVIVFTSIQKSRSGRYVKKLVDFDLVIPSAIQTYYRSQPINPTIILYEHMANLASFQYPRCELIGYWDTKNSTISYTHDLTSSLGSSLQKLIDIKLQSYLLGTPVPFTLFPVSKLSKIGVKLLSQKIDSYGKCRCITISYKKFIGDIFTDPMQPLILKETLETDIKFLPLKIIKKIVKELQIEFISQIVTDYFVTAYTCILGNIKITFPFNIESREIPLDLPIINTIRNSQESKLTLYLQNKKIAYYMIQYIRWLYSRFLNSNNLDHSQESLSNFANTGIQVDSDFEYGIISKKFDENSGITRNNVLFVHDEETLKRLLYTLNLYANRFPLLIKQYFTRIYITNFYINDTDFTKHRSQVILLGEDSVKKWRQEMLNKLILYNSVQNLPGPYFLRNSLISNKIYLAQNTSSLGKALEISKVWDNSGINNTMEINDSKDCCKTEGDFNLFAYLDSKNIEAYICENMGCIREKDKSNNISNIIIYKNKNKDHFTSLLAFE